MSIGEALVEELKLAQERIEEDATINLELFVERVNAALANKEG